MIAYNGFTASQRRAALRWLRAEQAAGRRSRPTSCDACGGTRQVAGHSEDYSRPFGDHVGRFALCSRCHTILHRRVSAPAAFEAYASALELRATGGDPGLLRRMAAGVFRPDALDREAAS